MPKFDLKKNKTNDSNFTKFIQEQCMKLYIHLVFVIYLFSSFNTLHLIHNYVLCFGTPCVFPFGLVGVCRHAWLFVNTDTGKHRHWQSSSYINHCLQNNRYNFILYLNKLYGGILVLFYCSVANQNSVHSTPACSQRSLVLHVFPHDNDRINKCCYYFLK